MTYVLDLVTFFATSVGNIFLAFDNIPFLDAGFSILDVFVAIMLWNLIVWFIIRVFTGKNNTDSNERVYSSDSEEILHE